MHFWSEFGLRYCSHSGLSVCLLQASLCSCDDIVTAFAPDRLHATLRSLLYPCEAPTSSKPISLDSDTISTTITNITLTTQEHLSTKDLAADINSEAVTNIDTKKIVAKEGQGELSDTCTLRKRNKGGDGGSESFPLGTKGTSLDTSEIVEEGKYLSFILLFVFFFTILLLYYLPSSAWTMNGRHFFLWCKYKLSNSCNAFLKVMVTFI